MTRLTALVGLAVLSLGLASCGDSPEEKATKPASTQPPKVEVSRDFLEVAGRWQSAEGQIPGGGVIVLDMASNGSFTIDVRAQRNGTQAIVEEGRGKAVKKGEAYEGVVDKGSGIHDVLGSAMTWRLDPKAGTLTPQDGRTIAIARNQ